MHESLGQLGVKEAESRSRTKKSGGERVAIVRENRAFKYLLKRSISIFYFCGCAAVEEEISTCESTEVSCLVAHLTRAGVGS
jgi:hypothetical protein